MTAARAIVEEPTVAVSANRRSPSLSRDKRHRRKSPLYLASERRPDGVCITYDTVGRINTITGPYQQGSGLATITFDHKKWPNFASQYRRHSR